MRVCLFKVNNGARRSKYKLLQCLENKYSYTLDTSQELEHSNNIPVVVLTLHIGNYIVGRSIGFQYSQFDDVGPGLEEMESDLQYPGLRLRHLFSAVLLAQ